MRLKLSKVVDGLARSIREICNYPEESNQALVVRQAVHAWALNQGLFEGLGAEGGTDPCSEPSSSRSRRSRSSRRQLEHVLRVYVDHTTNTGHPRIESASSDAKTTPPRR